MLYILNIDWCLQYGLLFLDVFSEWKHLRYSIFNWKTVASVLNVVHMNIRYEMLYIL